MHAESVSVDGTLRLHVHSHVAASDVGRGGHWALVTGCWGHSMLRQLLLRRCYGVMALRLRLAPNPQSSSNGELTGSELEDESEACFPNSTFDDAFAIAPDHLACKRRMQHSSKTALACSSLSAHPCSSFLLWVLLTLWLSSLLNIFQWGFQIMTHTQNTAH